MAFTGRYFGSRMASSLVLDNVDNVFSLFSRRLILGFPIGMKLSVIIVNYNVKHFLKLCLDSVYRAGKGLEMEVIVVDNQSRDGSMEMVATRFPQTIRIVNEENLGFSRANNQGVARAKGTYILFLNPDTVMEEDFLNLLMAYMDAHPSAGAIGPQLLDGKGQYAPDGKKSFPTLRIALFKVLGLHKLFPRSPFFNGYYAVHVGRDEVAAVSVLSGCCMMVRKTVIDQLGFAFDEDYFMYCEDVDLSYRIQKVGYQNIYYPPARLIHYKGESTRKGSLSYVRIFNEALITFVRKHYSRAHARQFIFLIQVGIFFRALLGGVTQVLKGIRMPLLDAALLLLTLWGMEKFWVEQVKEVQIIPLPSILITFPIYVVIWILSLYLNGVYDHTYKPFRVIRGMAMGTVLVLAYYGLLPPEFRYSRGIIFFSAFVGTVGLLGFHELGYRLGIFRFNPVDRLASKALVVAGPAAYEQVLDRLRDVDYAPQIIGRVDPVGEASQGALGPLSQLRNLARTADVDEIIFSMETLSYKEVLDGMKESGPEFDYKIQVKGSRSFVGSNSSEKAGEVYSGDREYLLADSASSRNKRVLDMVFSLLIFAGIWAWIWFIPRRYRVLRNAGMVFVGKKTWVGYCGVPDQRLPKIRASVLPCYPLIDGFRPDVSLCQTLNRDYALHYTPLRDLRILWSNRFHLGSSGDHFHA